MHAIKGSWAGQAFALATNNYSGGKRSRIRRSKEERKTMVESFIQKYQKKNDGNFPSLNLTHKEVGGSFYTVREIVREIIQENRVLAPPKVSLEEHDHSAFLEQHPLGSISVEPQDDISVSDRIHIVTHFVPSEYQITTEEEFINGKIVNGPNQVAEKDDESDGTEISYSLPDHYSDTSTGEVSDPSELLPQPMSQDFENEKIINGGDVLQEKPYSEKELIMNTVFAQNQENKDSVVLSDEKICESGPKFTQDQYNKYRVLDKAEEFGQRIHTKRFEALEVLDGQKDEVKEVEASEVEIYHMNSDVVVETFPIRPVSRTVHEVDGEPSKSLEAARTLEDEAIERVEMKSVNSFSKLVNEKDGEELLDSTVGDRVVVDLQELVPETSKLTPMSKHGAFTDGNPTERLISNNSNAVGRKSLNQDNGGRKSIDQDNGSLPKDSNPTLDRINLDTWDGASKKSIKPEANPLLVLLKAFISAFVKFWTE